jgi:hypothetical protein
MRYWIGVVLFAAAVGLVVSAIVHKRKVLAARAAAAARGVPPAETVPFSVGALGEGMRPLILLFLASAAAMMVLLFVLPGGDDALSLFDLGGVLAALAAYGTWMSLRVSYRMSDVVRAEAEAASPAAAAEPDADATGGVAPARDAG